MKQNFIGIANLIKQIEQKKNLLSDQIAQLKDSVHNFEEIENPLGLLMVSNSIPNIDKLIKCVKPSIRVLLYDSLEWSLDIFKSKLSEVLYGVEYNQLSLVGWVFDNNNDNLKLCSDYEIILNQNHNISQYQ